MAATNNFSARNKYGISKVRAQRLFVIIAILVLFEKSVLAKTNAELVTNFMIQDGNGGKQVADGTGNQHLTIIEPVIYLDTKIGKSTTLFGSALVDMWTSASEAIFDSSTGASGGVVTPTSAGNSATEGNLQNRVAVNFGVTQKLGSWTITPRLGYSTEFDYHSYNGGITVDKSLANDNFVLSAGYQLFVDQTLPFDVTSSSFLGWQNKSTQSFDVSASQILSPSDLLLVGYNFTIQNGFLSGSQNTVDVSGTRISEVLPSLRNRHAMSLRYVHGFTDNIATHLDYRFYLDNWGITAHTAEPSLYFSFGEDTGIVKVFYRYHRQSKANYYKDAFPTANTYMTSDSDLAKFAAHEGGLMVSKKWDIKNFPLKSVSLTASGLYYYRTNDLRGQLYQLGLKGEF